ncbi:hypothetical protein LTR66_005449 [Elasticomyces elasticus]|nr:hypothetical protein LTR66_005449 [Elasticomyces elasticus]
MTIRSTLQPGLAEVDGGPRLVNNSIWGLLSEGHQKNPNGPAFISMHQPAEHLAALVGQETPSPGPCLSWTYAQLLRGASRIAAGLTAQGVRRGSTLVTFVVNCAEWSLLYWTAAMLQLTFVPLDPHILEPTRVHDLKYFLQVLNPSSIVVHDSIGAHAIDDAYQQIAVNIGAKFVCESSSHGSPAPWPSLADIVKIGVADHDINPNEVFQDEALDAQGTRTAIILFTSGTSTGRPKGCPLSVANVVSASNPSFGVAVDSSTRAVAHSASFRAIYSALSLACWRLGAAVVRPYYTFSAGRILDAIESHTCTMMTCVPAQVHAFADDPSLPTRRLGSFQILQLGGDIVTTDMVHKARRVFGNAVVTTVCGMTEGAGFIGWPSDLVKAPPPSFGGIVALGKVLPGAKIRICDVEGQVVKRGETGELHVSSPSMIERYLGDVQPELFYKDDAGKWLITGDRAKMDEAGCVYILGRSKDIIKRKGVPLSPAVIESLLDRYANIQVHISLHAARAASVISDSPINCEQAQVIGISHPIVGEEPIAIVQSHGKHIDLDSVRQAVVDGLGPDYALAGVLTLDQLGLLDFPINATGKVMKGQVKDAAVRYLQQKQLAL